MRTVEAAQSTEEVLREMMVENTGCHTLDSGDYYGRHFERNRAHDFTNAPSTTIQVEDFGETSVVIITHSVYHFLKECLEYAPKFDRLFRKFAAQEDSDKPWLELMREFPDWLAARGYDVRPGPTINTANGDDLLSQVIQYTVVDESDQGRALVLLQIHGGCDLRGGYTRPRAFWADLTGENGVGLLENAHATAWCAACGGRWHTYNGGGEWEDCVGYGYHNPRFVVDAGGVRCPACGEYLEFGF